MNAPEEPDEPPECAALRASLGRLEAELDAIRLALPGKRGETRAAHVQQMRQLHRRLSALRRRCEERGCAA